MGVLHKEKGSDFSSDLKEEIFDPFHIKYIVSLYNTDNIALLVNIISNTIKETRGTAENLHIVLSFWDYDNGSSGSSAGGGGGEAIKDRSFLRMYLELIKSNRGVGR